MSERALQHRSKSASRIALSLCNVRAGHDPGAEVWSLLVDSVGSRERELFVFVRDTIEAVTSPEAADALGIERTDASNMLRYLWELGLLRREEHITEEGRHFTYSVNWTLYPVQADEKGPRS